MQRWCVLLLCSFAVLFACDATELEATLEAPGIEDPDEDEPSTDESTPAPTEPDPEPTPEPTPEHPEDEHEPAPAGHCSSFDLVWPTTKSADEQTLVHDAFGPRLRGDGYDWHRGIDLPGDADDDGFHSPAYAVADGSIYAIGNRPNPNQGALSNYSKTAGNVIILEHQEDDLHPGAQTLYSVYMHLDTLPLEAFPARLGDDEQPVEGGVDLTEYFYLDGPMANANNRGRRRPTLKSTGEVIEAYPRVHQADHIAIIADTGSTFEHLHFELREGSPHSADVVNPFTYLPHLDTTMHDATLSATPEGLRARVEIPREGGSLGATTDLSQQLDVESICVQLREGESVVDELRVEFEEIGLFDDADIPSFELDGAQITLSPHEFGSDDAVWRLDVDFAGLELAELVPTAGQRYVLEVTDVCGNRFLAEL